MCRCRVPEGSSDQEPIFARALALGMITSRGNLTRYLRGNVCPKCRKEESQMNLDVPKGRSQPYYQEA